MAKEILEGGDGSGKEWGIEGLERVDAAVADEFIIVWQARRNKSAALGRRRCL